MECMHDLGVTHRDIKLDNILVNDKMEIYIKDFGSSTCNNNEATQIGSHPYIAPEVNSHASFDGITADIFSLGVLLFVMVTGRIPFRQASENDKYY
jgi:serine/threonine protein kinase